MTASNQINTVVKSCCSPQNKADLVWIIGIPQASFKTDAEHCSLIDIRKHENIDLILASSSFFI